MGDCPATFDDTGGYNDVIFEPWGGVIEVMLRRWVF